MFSSREAKISTPIVQAIEDAVLFGNIKEIDGVLDIVREDEGFPDGLRYGLEALMYFRIHYGKGGDLEPATDNDRQKVAVMETSWCRELIESIGHCPDMTEPKYA
jgi:hypothetical protein